MDMVNGINSVDNVTGTSSLAQDSSVQAPEERMFKQSELNEIVKRAKYGAVEDYRRLQSERPDYLREKYADTHNDREQNTKSSANLTEADLRKLAAEEIQRHRDEWIQEAQSKSEAEIAQRTVQNFWNKIAPGKEKYQDFEKVVGDIEFSRFPNVVQLLADHVDNSHDVLYELGKDRGKMAILEQLAYMSPKDAIVQAKRLSESIKDNEAASKVKIPNAPLNPLRPSQTGTDNGVLSVSDYRKRYKV